MHRLQGQMYNGSQLTREKMMTTVEAPVLQMLREKRAEILVIADRHGAVNVGVFGSVARGDAGPESDIDLLVDIRPPLSPWFPGGLALDLEELLGRSVDIATEGGLHPILRKRIERDLVTL